MKSLFIALFLTANIASANVEFMRLFKNSKPVIAAVMVTDEISTLEAFAKTKEWTLKQAEIAAQGRMDGILVEFRGGGIMDNDISKNKLQAMTDIVSEMVAKFPSLVVGVEILWHYPGSTLLLAKNSGAKFVRLDFFSDRVVAGGREVPIDPPGVIAFKKKISASQIALLTDVQVKYSKMVNSKISISQSAKTAVAAGSNGVIISGSKSGSSPDTKKLAQARKGLLKTPLIIGSGFSRENAPQILPYVDAIIVGTSISEKTGGPLMPEKIQELMVYIEKNRGNRHL